ncbi:nucleoporin protein Ndc1-Nup [Sporodiniella umbellata]|nr:nucleoporin protein Ndc1-Nup [Sporodiniella umbellata]
MSKPLFETHATPPNMGSTSTLTRTNAAKYSLYTDAFQANLRQQHLQLAAYLAGFSILLNFLFQSNFSFSIYSLFTIFSGTQLYHALLLFLAGGIVFCLRCLSMTIYKDIYPSQMAHLLAMVASPDTWLTWVCYVLSGFITISSYFATIPKEESIVRIFERPTGHYIDVRQLNQKNIFITLYILLLSAKYVAFHFAKNKNQLHVRRARQPLFFELRGHLKSMVHVSAKEALSTFLITYVTFLIFSGNIYYSIAFTVGKFNRVLDSPIVGFRWVDLYLFTRIIKGGMMTLVLWNFVHCLFDAIFSSMTSIPQAKPFECILTGLSQTKDELAQAAAFNELALIASKDATQRIELFTSIGKELNQTVWYRIMKQCFHVIDDLRRSINPEYQGLQPVPAPEVFIQKPLEKKRRHQLQFSEEQDIYSPQKGQVREYDDRTSTLFGQADEWMESVPVDHPVVQQATHQAWIKLNRFVAILQKIELKMGYKGYFEKFYQESRVTEVKRLFRKTPLIMWAIQILGSLIACSAKEDSYGYVQSDISDVLNHLLGCYVDIETYIKREGVQLEEVEAVKKTLEEAILQIVITFNDYLSVFVIESRYKPLWERFSSFH